MRSFLPSPRSWMAAVAVTASYFAPRGFSLRSSTILGRGSSVGMKTALYQTLGSNNSNENRIHPSLRSIHSQTSEITHTTLPNDKRVVAYCLSDMHADGTSDNWNWIQRKCLPAEDSRDAYNILIIPGDQANTIPSLRRSFRFLASHWDAVCYCVGNHEAWVNENYEQDNEDEEMYAANFRSSVEELEDVLEVAKKEGISVGPVCVHYYSDNPQQESQELWMVPLQSFYHSSWDTEPEPDDPVLLAAEQKRSFAKRWQDFRNMKWPTELTSEKEFTQGDDGRGGSLVLAKAFGDLNEGFLEFWADDSFAPSSSTVLSFSHYVPRIELSIEKRFLVHPSLARVVGSNRLEEDVRRLQPDLHLFGHTHIPIAMECDGIRYAQWPLGYPREATLQCRTVAATGPMRVFDSGKEGILRTIDAEKSHWSRHYAHFQRDPNNLELAPWVRERLERVGGKRR